MQMNAPLYYNQKFTQFNNLSCVIQGFLLHKQQDNSSRNYQNVIQWECN